MLTGCTLGKGNFARVESAVHTLTRGKVGNSNAIVACPVIRILMLSGVVSISAGGNQNH